jgi:hypothetical protein
MFKFLKLRGVVLELRHRKTGVLAHVLNLDNVYRLIVGEQKADFFSKSATLFEVLLVADRMAGAEK